MTSETMKPAATPAPSNPRATAPQAFTAPEDLAPWRSLTALCDRLNEGADTPSFGVHGVRHYVYAAEDGREPELLPFVRRIGRKILISEPGFLHWLATRPYTRNR